MQPQKMLFPKKSFQLLSTFISAVAAISIPLNTVFANELILTREKNTVNKLLVSQQPIMQKESANQIKAVAKKLNSTLVQYSIINNEENINGKKQTRDSQLYIWVIKPTGEITFSSVELKPFLQKENSSLADLITNTRQSLGISSTLKGNISVTRIKKENNTQKLQQLHKILIQPIADILPQNPDSKVIFIPQGALFFVPFAALADTNGKYLIEKHTISTAPSIEALDLLYQRKQRNTGVTKNALIVGNPTMPNVACLPGETPQKLSQLAGAEQEAKKIAQILQTQALTGDAATKTAVVKRMSNASIIHLATQGCADNKNGLDSALVLASSKGDNGLLTAREIIDMKLNADLVVLSSCDTALGKITGDGVIGFSRSFLAAGVPSVIGSLWSPSDSETAFLMTQFYENLSKNPDKAVALRQAILSAMKNYPDAKSWAAFTLIGLP